MFSHVIVTRFGSDLKSILDITQVITKAYQVTKANHNTLICTIAMSDFLTQPKRPGVCIRSNNLIAQCCTLFSF